MTEITLQIDNESILPSLKKVLSSIAGVKVVSRRTTKNKKVLMDPETGNQLKDEVIDCIQDIKSGKEETQSFDSFEEARQWLES